METFTPLVRRIIALGLAVLAFVVAFRFIITPLFDANHSALVELANVRGALMHAQAIQAAPPPPKIAVFPRATGIVAPSVQAARDAFAGYVTAQALPGQLQVGIQETPSIHLRPPGPIDLKVTATGPRSTLLAWISKLETGRPSVKFRSYQLTAIDAPLAGPPQLQQPSPSASAAPERTLRLDATIATLWIGQR